jgi:hypothetical protein
MQRGIFLSKMGVLADLEPDAKRRDNRIIFKLSGRQHQQSLSAEAQ